MEFVEGNVYHIYNRGNNKQPIFFTKRNYYYFIEKFKRYVCGCSDLLCWALMPNHFHFLIHANADTCRMIKHSPVEINALTEGLRLLLSSYSKGVQRQEKLTGNLFQQKTKSKCVDSDESNYYSTTAFHYIHQNPLRAGLELHGNVWEFSSLNEYLKYGNANTQISNDGFDIENLCNRRLAYEILDLTPEFIRSPPLYFKSEEAISRIF
jgi:putative transposase